MCVSFPFSLAAQSGPWGPSLSGTYSSFQHLRSNCVCSNRGLRAPTAGYWYSLPHLISNSSDHQLIELPVHRVILLFDDHLLVVGFTNHTYSTRPRSRLYPDIPRPDAPVIYTGAFPVLTAWLGSLCNCCMKQRLVLKKTKTKGK